MNGADRIQYYFDRVSRRRTGTGNVIRAYVTIEGIVPENLIRENILTNSFVRLLSSTFPKRNLFSTVYLWKQGKVPGELLQVHRSANPDDLLPRLMQKDCSFTNGSPFCIDVLYSDSGETGILFSANHTLMDYRGMENLLGSFAGDENGKEFSKPLPGRRNFFEKFSDAVQVTSFVASRSSRNFSRLKQTGAKPAACAEQTVLSPDETEQVKTILRERVRTNALPYFLATAAYTFTRNTPLLTGSDKLFITAPLDRRPVTHQSVILSNYLSFLSFSAGTDQLKNIPGLSRHFAGEVLEQAKKKIPDKFISFLDLFRFLPDWLYKLWLELPTNGHSASFAFSLLPPSAFEKQTFMGFTVKDVFHYPPVITPPGLNFVFTEFRSQLKIIASFDESRISRTDARKMLDELKYNLTH